MDRQVTVRFFKVARTDPKGPTLKEVLEEIDAIDGLENRERELDNFYHARLEIYEPDGTDCVQGEMIRIQSTNYPSEISKGKRKKISVENRLGHSIVFRFNHKKSILAFQYDPRIMTASRFMQYLSTGNIAATFKLTPVVREDMWKRFESGAARELEIEVASPENLSALVGASKAVGDALQTMARAYDAPKIGVRVSMGHRKGQLADTVKIIAKDVLSLASAGTLNVSKLKAKAWDDDGTDPINLLEELLIERETLELDDKDPDINYEVKCKFLRRSLSIHTR